MTDPVLAQFTHVTRGAGRPLIISVHGLGGDAVTTFRADTASKTWPEIMRSNVDRVRGPRPLADYATATLSYPAGCADRVTIPQIAAGLVRTLYDDGDWSRHSAIIFIGHSAGGLVIMEMLTTSQNDHRYGGLVESTAGVIFLATPTGGSDHADSLASLIEGGPGFAAHCPLLKDLRSIDHNALLQKVEIDWRKFIQIEKRLKGNERRLRGVCLYETRSILGQLIVGQSASAAVCDERFGLNETHLSIAKPTSKASEVYKRSRGLIADMEVIPRSAKPNPFTRPQYLGQADEAPRHDEASPNRRLDTLQHNSHLDGVRLLICGDVVLSVDTIAPPPG